jgi:glutaconate CoA-transferase subunit B
MVGTGAPCAAAVLAQKLYSPRLTIMFEAGGIGPLLSSMPISVGDSQSFYRAIAASSMSEVMETCQRGLVDYVFLGGAQIDQYGNINSTMIGGSYQTPKVRFPGSGGANDLGSLCWKTMMITPQDKRRFTEKIDFITTPGYINGPGAREKAGLPPGCGPYKVITNLCVIGFDEQSKRMKVESIHPGRTKEEIIENTGFELLWADDLVISEPPSKDELAVLRNEIDPYRYIIGRQ